jgi:hypothetical protein
MDTNENETSVIKYEDCGHPVGQTEIANGDLWCMACATNLTKRIAAEKKVRP